MIELDTAKRFFLLAGLGFMMSTSFFMVKNTKDNIEFQKLLAPLVRQQYSDMQESSPIKDSGTLPIAEEAEHDENDPFGMPGEGPGWPTGPSQAEPPFGSDAESPSPMPPAAPPPLLPHGQTAPMASREPSSQDMAQDADDAREDEQAAAEAARIIEQLGSLRGGLGQSSGNLNNLRALAESTGADNQLSNPTSPKS